MNNAEVNFEVPVIGTRFATIGFSGGPSGESRMKVSATANFVGTSGGDLGQNQVVPQSSAAQNSVGNLRSSPMY
jgi:hypothetical protein